jgi:ABC-type transport system involved in cytochrome bd biosynthesis fused ATPase/permease subunit
MLVLAEQEEHTEKSKSATRGDLTNDLGEELDAVLSVAVRLCSPWPLAIAISAGSIIATSITTLSKQITIFFISNLLAKLTAYYHTNGLLPLSHT